MTQARPPAATDRTGTTRAAPGPRSRPAADTADSAATDRPPERDPEPRSRGRWRPPAASPAQVVGATLTAAAGAVRLAAIVTAMLLGVAIVFAVFHANPANTIVGAVRAVDGWLVGPWHDAFTPRSAIGREVANRAVAAAVYLVAGLWLAGLLRRAAGRVRR